MIFLKYEKKLYEITEEQASRFRDCIDRGRKIFIGMEVLNAGKCEIIDDYPANREEYDIKPIQRTSLEEKRYNWTPNTREDWERKSKLLAEIRQELVSKLGWKH